jgi:YgiT-type zinc finger domain-containing protein
MPLTADRADPAQTVGAVQTTLQHWRQAHPRATLREIELEVDRQLAAVRTGLVEQIAHQGPDLPRPSCPTCGETMHRVGVRHRTVLTAQDETLRLHGTGYRCPACGAGLFPPGGSARSGS